MVKVESNRTCEAIWDDDLNRKVGSYKLRGMEECRRR